MQLEWAAKWLVFCLVASELEWRGLTGIRLRAQSRCPHMTITGSLLALASMRHDKNDRNTSMVNNLLKVFIDYFNKSN
jgi:hypothetical protein